jgi:uncharacterized membrane protein YtjA (UPF0391 family)
LQKAATLSSKSAAAQLLDITSIGLGKGAIPETAACKALERARPVPRSPSGARLMTAGSSMEGEPMLYWAVVFLIIAIVAGILGFGGIASTAASMAQVLFFIFLVIFVVALVMGLMRRRPPPI